MSLGRYILVGHTPVRCDDLLEWAEWEERALRDGSYVVAKTNVSSSVEVSTVFLGLDHQWGDGPPILFETMIFGGPRNQTQWRYATWDEAVDGHAYAVAYAGVTTTVDADA